jgi:hypothetical protein
VRDLPAAIFFKNCSRSVGRGSDFAQAARQRPRIATIRDDENVLGRDDFEGGRDLVGDDPVRVVVERGIYGEPVSLVGIFIVDAMTRIVDEQIRVRLKRAPVRVERRHNLLARGVQQ